jgi:hypothetical protein
MSTLNDIVHGLTTGPKLRDWQHANKIFVGNNYALKPKDSWLFHVSFDINNVVNMSRLSSQQVLEMGLLVKSIQIPKYTIDTKTMNAYNRPNIIQQKLKYDPISITFHDDSSDTIRDFWYDYMSHYYRDTDYTPDTYLNPYKYQSAETNVSKNFWGYQPQNYDTVSKSERLLNRIKIYSLYQKKFSEYILVNPYITNFSHGQHQQGQSDFMENTMTVAYETVLYSYGTVSMSGINNGGEPAGFAMLNYDNTPSPLSPQGGGTNSIFGPGGLTSAVTGIGTDLATNTGAGIAQAGLTAARAYTNLSGQNLLSMAGTELQGIASGILTGNNNTLNRLTIPTAGPTNGSLGVESSIGD